MLTLSEAIKTGRRAKKLAADEARIAEAMAQRDKDRATA